jgi:hypothetical protein
MHGSNFDFEKNRFEVIHHDVFVRPRYVRRDTVYTLYIIAYQIIVSLDGCKQI